MRREKGSKGDWRILFVHFGPFSIKEDRVGDVIDMIGRLIQMRPYHYLENEPVSILLHMSKLDTLLYQKMPLELYRGKKEKRSKNKFPRYWKMKR